MASGCHFFFSTAHSLPLPLSLAGSSDFRFLNLAECVKGRSVSESREEEEKKEEEDVSVDAAFSGSVHSAV